MWWVNCFYLELMEDGNGIVCCCCCCCGDASDGRKFEKGGVEAGGRGAKLLRDRECDVRQGLAVFVASSRCMPDVYDGSIVAFRFRCICGVVFIRWRGILAVTL